MKKTLTGVLVVLSALLILIFSLSASAGTFKDRDGASHAWSIGQAHELVWDGSPYIPFGAVFIPSYLSEQTDANLAADKATVDALKSAGITDVLIRPGDKGLSLATPEAFQRIIDLLEGSGLSYGIELDLPPYEPLVGYFIDPRTNRVDGIRSSGEVTRNFADTKTALYVLCDSKTGEVRRTGQAIAVNGDVTAPVPVQSDSPLVMLFYPQKVIAAGNSDWGLPDLWTEGDSRRDRLTAFLSQVKFGKGLRFFVDPLGENLGIHGQVHDLMPNSPAFRLEYAAWLSRKYKTTTDLSVAWGIRQHDLDSYKEAANLIPLWNNGRGVAYVYDDSSQTKYAVDINVSSIWNDFREFRTQSVRAYMDSISDVLKRTAADVPVAYTATELEQIFQPNTAVGYDALVSPAADSRDGNIMATGHAYSLAEGASRRLWMFSRLKPVQGSYQKKEDLFSQINTSRSLGSKGFFVDKPVDTSADAGMLGWLGEYAGTTRSDKSFASYRPRTVYYPQGATNVSPKRLDSGAWWLPELAVGQSISLGDTLTGYALADPRDHMIDIYLWSLKGDQVIHVATPTPLTVTDAGGNTTELKPKKGMVAIPITDEPMLVRGIALEQFLPVEVVTQAMNELAAAIAAGEQANVDMSLYKHSLDRVEGLIEKNQLSVAFNMARSTAAEIRQRLQSVKTGSTMDNNKVPGE